MNEGDLPTGRPPRRDEGLPPAPLVEPTVLRPDAGRDFSSGAPTPPFRGRDLGRYLIQRELGRGGMGVVYLAHDRTLDRDVALKVLRVGGWVAREVIERFEREARAAAALEHPHIVRVHDVGTLPDGAPFYTMEVLPGQDLGQAIASGGLAPREAVEAVRQVALALQYAHQRGILHRDIKPQNIFLRQESTPPPVGAAAKRDAAPPTAAGNLEGIHALLLDFGLAKLAERDLEAHAEGTDGRRSMQSLTRSGEIFGTPSYMPPEQTHGAKDVDLRADVYSLGASLYHALAGRAPFDAASLADLLVKVQQEDPFLPSRFNADVDRDLDTIVVKCLQKEPGDRYQDAGELAEDLRRWSSGDPISGRSIGFAGRVWRKAKRNRAVAIPMSALAFLLLVGLSTWGGVAVRNWAALREAVAQGRAALVREDLSAAIAAARTAQVLAPDDRDVLGLLAEVSLAQGERAREAYVALKGDIERMEADGGLPLQEATSEAQRDVARRVRWRREEALGQLRRRRGEAWSDAVRWFVETLSHVSSHGGARSGLADLYWDELMGAEEARDRAEEARYRALVIEYGGEKATVRVRGERDVRVRFKLPSGFQGTEVMAHLFEYQPCGDPLVLVPVPYDPKTNRGLIAPTVISWKPIPASSASSAPGVDDTVTRARSGVVHPLIRLDDNHVVLPVQGDGSKEARFHVRLPRGSYLLYVAPGQGLIETRYPFDVARDAEWDEACELVSDRPPSPPSLPSILSGDPKDAWSEGPYWAYVPAGPYRASGDPAAQQAPPRRAGRLRVPESGAQGVFIARFEVTCAMYLEYLNDLAWHGDDPRKAFAHVPRRDEAATSETAYCTQDSDGRIRLGGHLQPDWPAVGIGWPDAIDYMRWLTARRGEGRWQFNLPTEDEWEKAARGPDGRFYPWGDSIDDTFCRMMGSRPADEHNLPEVFGLFPLDESPYGVRDTAGTMREWTATADGAKFRVMKGGAFNTPAGVCRSASRTAHSPVIVRYNYSFRLCAHRIP